MTSFPAFEYPFLPSSRPKPIRKRKAAPIIVLGKEMGLEDNFTNFQKGLKQKCAVFYERKIASLQEKLNESTREWRECLQKLSVVMTEIEDLSRRYESEKQTYFQLLNVQTVSISNVPIVNSVSVSVGTSVTSDLAISSASEAPIVSAVSQVSEVHESFSDLISFHNEEEEEPVEPNSVASTEAFLDDLSKQYVSHESVISEVSAVLNTPVQF